jgi:hypothetical protein
LEVKNHEEIQPQMSYEVSVRHKVATLTIRKKRNNKPFYCLIDEADLPRIEGWELSIYDGSQTYYVRAYKRDGVWTMGAPLHRILLDLADPTVLVDHRNRNGLDNRRHNLRLATSLQNAWNSGPSRTSQTGYKGVTKQKVRSKKGGSPPKWQAMIRIDGKNKRLTGFSTPEEAALAYDREAEAAFGEFAYLNFPNGPPQE